MKDAYPDWKDVTNLLTDAGIDPYRRRLRVRSKGNETFFKVEVPDGAQVVGFTPAGKLVTICEKKKDTSEQYTHLPAGMADDGEELGQTATREFYEETGYGFASLLRISTCNQSTPHLFGLDVVYVALGCKKLCEPTEPNISVIEMAPEQFERELCDYLTKNPLQKGSGRNSLASFRLAMHVANRDGLLNPQVTDSSPMLVAIMGMPRAGKTTLGDALKKALGIHFIDVDRLKKETLGLPTRAQYEELWKDSKRAGELTAQYMKLAYMSMHAAVDINLQAGRSIVCTATYSRKDSQESLREIGKKYGARVKVVFLRLENDTQDEVMRRMKCDNGEFVQGCSTWADYLQIKARYEPVTKTDAFPKESIIEIDTGQPPDACVAQALEFIKK